MEFRFSLHLQPEHVAVGDGDGDGAGGHCRRVLRVAGASYLPIRGPPAPSVSHRFGDPSRSEGVDSNRRDGFFQRVPLKWGRRGTCVSVVSGTLVFSILSKLPPRQRTNSLLFLFTLIQRRGAIITSLYRSR